MNGTDYGVLLAVGPDGVGEGALDITAAEAVRRGTGIQVVHVVHQLVTVPADMVQMELVDRELTAVGRRVLTRAAGALRERVGDDVPISTELLAGGVSARLVDRTSDVDLVILERRDLGTLERLATMSISTRVGAHAKAPVLVVPRSWSAAGAELLPVTVGVSDPEQAVRLVAPAAAYAAATERELVVLHAAWVPEPYQGAGLIDSADEWVERARDELEKSLTELPVAPERLTYDVRWARPVDALVRATRGSAVLVLNRRAGQHPLGGHLGGTTRAVLHHATCPVLLADR